MAHHIMKRLFLVLITKFLVSATVSNGPTLEFLKGVRRLNTAGYIDYYFYCRAKGRFLQWKLNEEHISFQVSDEVGLTKYIERPSYEYTATLLSSKPVGNGNRAMDSILLVSFMSSEPSSFEVTCSNGSHSETVQAGLVTNVTNYIRNQNIVLNYIASATIVRNKRTHIFICGVNHTFLLLQASGQPLTFSSNDKLGTHRVASADTYTVYEQGIFIARNPVPTVSILIVAQDTDAEVTEVSCFYRTTTNLTHVAQLRSTLEPVTATSTTSTAAATLPGTSMTIQETTPQTITEAHTQDSNGLSNANRNISVLSAIIVTVVVLVLLVQISGFATAAVICSQCYIANKHTRHHKSLTKTSQELNKLFAQQIDAKTTEDTETGCMQALQQAEEKTFGNDPSEETQRGKGPQKCASLTHEKVPDK